MRDVAILRFSRSEGPAYFADWLDTRGIRWRLIPIDEGSPVPRDPRAFAGIAMMGGPMSVNDALPWIAPVCQLLQDAVATEIPVIGHCLGGQLLAKALGASVVRSGAPEIGWIDVEVDPGPARHEWFGDRVEFETFQWHNETFGLPQGATRVLTNRHNANQAYVIDNTHIALQCHVEMTPELVTSWLETGLGDLPNISTPTIQSADDIARDLDSRIATLHRVAGDIYARWAKGLHR